MKKTLSILLALVLLFSLAACSQVAGPTEAPTKPFPTFPEETLGGITIERPEDDGRILDKNGSYTTKEDVGLYIHLYGHLPSNFITKAEAKKLGWNGNSLGPYAPGKCIGGDVFHNREGILPKSPGRTFTECDIDTLGGAPRGRKRIVFSNDGLVFYTDDHYRSFTLLYGEIENG